MTSTLNLRKPFRYPSEPDPYDSDSSSPELDEQDQELLISSLKSRDQDSTRFYRLAFPVLPLLCMPLYLASALFVKTSASAASPARAFLIAVLSLTSLAASAYTVYFLPPRSSSDDDDDDESTGKRSNGKRSLYTGDPRGPVERYMIPLNALLSAFLALVAVLAWKKELVEDFWRGILPGAIFLVILFARSQMAPIDTTALARLQYNYKGA